MWRKYLLLKILILLRNSLKCTTLEDTIIRRLTDIFGSILLGINDAKNVYTFLQYDLYIAFLLSFTNGKYFCSKQLSNPSKRKTFWNRGRCKIILELLKHINGKSDKSLETNHVIFKYLQF